MAEITKETFEMIITNQADGLIIAHQTLSFVKLGEISDKLTRLLERKKNEDKPGCQNTKRADGGDPG